MENVICDPEKIAKVFPWRFKDAQRMDVRTGP